MPTYQYMCTACSEDIEAVQAFSDAALTECPACGGRLRKVFGAVGVVFKGSGFYTTDSRAGANGRGKAAGKENEAPADGKKEPAEGKGAPADGKKEPAAASSSSTSSTATSASPAPAA